MGADQYRIDQDRIGPAELDDAGGQLGNLGIRVNAWITSERDQRLDLAVFDVQGWGHGMQKPATRAGPRLIGNLVQLVTRVVTGNPGNLVLRSDAIEMPGCRSPHVILCRKDPLKPLGLRCILTELLVMLYRYFCSRLACFNHRIIISVRLIVFAAQPFRDITHGVEYAPDINMVDLLDIENQIGIAL